jgi:hypothetical protein
MAETLDQLEIHGSMVSSPTKTKAEFEKKELKLTARVRNPLILLFNVEYEWAEEGDNKLNDWDFYFSITDEKGGILHSDYKHFGEEEPGLIAEDEKSFQEYVKEESYLRYYKDSDNLQKGDGSLVKSIKTPSTPGVYSYTCNITVQFWAKKIGEESGLAKNKTESTDQMVVRVTVS